MMLGFVDELAAARAAIIREPEDAVVAVLMEEFDISEDPRLGVGRQDEWYHQPWLVDRAIRVMVQGFGMTQKDAAWRMGYSPGRAHNAWRPPVLEADELELYDAATGRLYL